MLNKVILIGNVGNDPDVKTVGSDKVANFSLATSESYKDKQGQKVTNTEWHNIVMWRQLAEIAEKWVKKGSQIYVEGKIKTRSWDDKDGVKRYTTEIVAETLRLLGGNNKPDQKTEPTATVATAESEPHSPFDAQDDDLPF